MNSEEKPARYLHNAISGKNFGGGKGVIINDKFQDKPRPSLIKPRQPPEDGQLYSSRVVQRLPYANVMLPTRPGSLKNNLPKLDDTDEWFGWHPHPDMVAKAAALSLPTGFTPRPASVKSFRTHTTATGSCDTECFHPYMSGDDTARSRESGWMSWGSSLSTNRTDRSGPKHTSRSRSSTHRRGHRNTTRSKRSSYGNLNRTTPVKDELESYISTNSQKYIAAKTNRSGSVPLSTARSSLNSDREGDFPDNVSFGSRTSSYIYQKELEQVQKKLEKTNEENLNLKYELMMIRKRDQSRKPMTPLAKFSNVGNGTAIMGTIKGTEDFKLPGNLAVARNARMRIDKHQEVIKSIDENAEHNLQTMKKLRGDVDRHTAPESERSQPAIAAIRNQVSQWKGSDPLKAIVNNSNTVANDEVTAEKQSQARNKLAKMALLTLAEEDTERSSRKGPAFQRPPLGDRTNIQPAGVSSKDQKNVKSRGNTLGPVHRRTLDLFTKEPSDDGDSVHDTRAPVVRRNRTLHESQLPLSSLDYIPMEAEWEVMSVENSDKGSTARTQIVKPRKKMICGQVHYTY